jgi:hypothetical protein
MHHEDTKGTEKKDFNAEDAGEERRGRKGKSVCARRRAIKCSNLCEESYAAVVDFLVARFRAQVFPRVLCVKIFLPAFAVMAP